MQLLKSSASLMIKTNSAYVRVAQGCLKPLNTSCQHLKGAAAIFGLLFFILSGLGIQPAYATEAGQGETKPYTSPKNLDPSYYEGHEATFESIALKIPAGTPQTIQLASSTASGRLKLNPELFIDLKLLIYGSPYDLQNNDFKAVEGGYYRHGDIPGEFRYHGFSADGNVFTNQRFPNDANSGSVLSFKNWVHLPWQTITGVYASPLNNAAIGGDPQAQAWFDRALPFQLLNSTNPQANQRDGGYLLEEHMVILSAPSGGLPGEGRLWHWVDDRRWYQTVSLPDSIQDRQQTPVNLKVEILEKGSHRFGLHGTVPVKVRLTATLMDGAAMTNSAGKALHNTRNEIQSWRLSEGRQNPQSLMTPQVFQTYNGTDLNQNATLTAEITLNVSRSNLDSQGRFTFAAETGITYLEGKASPIATASDTCQIGAEAAPQAPLQSAFSIADLYVPTRADFEQTPVRYANQSRGPVTQYHFALTAPASGQSTTFQLSALSASDEAVSTRLTDFVRSVMPEGTVHRQIQVTQTVLDANGHSHSLTKVFNAVIGGQSKAVELNLSLPEWTFDMRPYPAVDQTNHKQTAQLNVTVDGEAVDSAHFFSGQFKMSEVTGLLGASNEFVKVVVEAVSKDGVVSFKEHWVEVVSTQPKAQLSFSGHQKVNRKLAVFNDAPGEEDPRLAAAYPAVYTFSYKAVTGSDTSRKLIEISPDEKHLLYKSPGHHQVTLTAVNSLGRQSEPAILNLVIVQDQRPAVIFNFDKGVAIRGESIGTVIDIASTDGDLVGEAVIKVYFDSNVDGAFEAFVGEYTKETFTSFVPTELGAYRAILDVSESFGQPTLSNFITPTDTRKVSLRREILCENLRPVQSVDLETPRTPEKVDVLLMLSSKLPESQRVQAGKDRIQQANTLRLSGLDAMVHVWDLGEITERMPASTTQLFGTQYPPPTLEYTEGGYSGVLDLISVQDNGKYVDYGDYDTVETCETEQVWVGRYCPAADPFICYVNGGYVDVYETQEVCTTKKVWDSDLRWRSSYYGTYEGEISRTIEQIYDPEWLRLGASRYVVYSALPGEILPEPEAGALKTTADAKWFSGAGSGQLATALGAETITAGGPAEAMSQAITLISERHEVMPYKLMLLNEALTYHTVEVESEGDGLTGEMWGLSQDTAFDNPLPPQSFSAIDEFGTRLTVNAAPPDQEAQFYTTSPPQTTPPQTMSSVGHFVVKRKLKDVTPKPEFDLESNASSAAFTVHRKPVAGLTLKARFDTLLGQYRLYWTDTSQDPDHALSDPNRGIVRSDFRIRVPGGTWRYGLPDKLPGGTYEADYVVWDIEGQISDPVHYNFTVDNSAPEIQIVSVVPDPAFTGQRPVVTVLPKDHEGSPMSLKFTAAHKESSHAFTQQFSGLVSGKAFEFQISEPLKNGTYSLRAEVKDDRGVSEETSRSLTVRPPKILNAGVTGAWNHWRGQIDRQGRPMALNPNRFLSYEMLNFEIAAEGEPLSVTCRMSPELEAMVYTDPNGRVYRYEEAFGEAVPFPLQLKSAGDGLWRGSYKLPLAPSTLGWTDHRLKTPYWIEFTVTWPEHVSHYRFDNIELTGNIYDLIF
ncbi:Athe_2463 domain-containing protein [Acidaminobacter hydrogenoformans]|uniref:Ig-like domain (Group 3) n=1 Tax=Acidaminobacter hydrogenoformans DSM 2784 TaxID=1120920 RepID=A0A1G5S2Q7_9FIRM|nr:hypothetical protein [Acidaminobacter hydrogenoformans]SCZ80665.1 hypothetical protein SAMN03080599_02386 [Acidaminobacter hydrogenoformans DSM 2784]